MDFSQIHARRLRTRLGHWLKRLPIKRLRIWSRQTSKSKTLRSFRKFRYQMALRQYHRMMKIQSTMKICKSKKILTIKSEIMTCRRRGWIPEMGTMISRQAMTMKTRISNHQWKLQKENTINSPMA